MKYYTQTNLKVFITIQAELESKNSFVRGDIILQKKEHFCRELETSNNV